MKKINARVIQRILTLGPLNPALPSGDRDNGKSDPLPVAFLSGEKFALEVIPGAKNTSAKRAFQYGRICASRPNSSLCFTL